MTNRVEFNIDTSKIKELSKRLERINKSALPAAIRQTLNNAAYDMKTRSLLKSAKENFTERQKDFFKANSKYFPTQERSNVDRMKSVVGMVENKLHNKSTNYAVKNLEQQEKGGNIDRKTFIGMKFARTGKGNVRSPYRLGNINTILKADDNKAKSAKQRWIRTAIAAKMQYGSDAFVLGNKRSGGKQTLSHIEQISSKMKSRSIQIKRRPIYTVIKGRKIEVAGTNFMERAAHETHMRMPRMFKREALRQIKRYLK